MKIAAIRKVNEKMPYWMKRPFAGFIRGKLIKNRTFLAQYQELEAADAMSVEEKERLQLEKLRQTLIHAYEHTAYYKELFDRQHFAPEMISSVEELEMLPILTKELLKEHYAELQADDIDDFYEVSTGGTTGAPTHVLMERTAIYREFAFVYHFWSKFGYDHTSSRLAAFRGVDLNNKLSEINPLYQEIRMNVFLMNRNNIREYVKRIDRYGAEFVYGYPSAVYNFCRLAREAGIALAGRFKAALLISENLYEFQEDEITATLGCPIAMFYGHSERAVFGERYGDGYIFNPLYGVTEISADNKPIVTGFINGKTPLIRYEVDDQVEPIKDSEVNITDHCTLNVVPIGGTLGEDRIRIIEKSVRQKFGAALTCEVKVVSELETTARGKYQMVIRSGEGVILPPVYRIIGHRDREVLYGKDGEQISVAAINFHDKTFDEVAGYQFVQTEPGRCIINILPVGDALSDKQIKAIGRSVNGKFGAAIACDVQVVSQLELTLRGKYRMIIQRSQRKDGLKGETSL